MLDTEQTQFVDSIRRDCFKKKKKKNQYLFTIRVHLPRKSTPLHLFLQNMNFEAKEKCIKFRQIKQMDIPNLNFTTRDKEASTETATVSIACKNNPQRKR